MDRNEAPRKEGRRPRSAAWIMALIALPFLVGSGVSVAHQLARTTPVEPGTHATEQAPATAGVFAADSDRT